MNIKSEDLNYEKKHLAEVVSMIRAIIKEKNVNIQDYKASIVERKRFMYEHSNEFFGADLYAHMNEEDLNVSILNKDIIKVYKLHRSLETPYFSRIDFKTSEGTDTFYIGLTGIDKDYDIIVYDWRAPVANLYYNYGIGASSFEGGAGMIEGETVLKRQFDIKMGELLSVYDNEVGVNDALLESVLQNNTSEYMRNIVDTIQKEQNEVIRYSGNSSLIVEGVAGSGKTSVALHRVAYLLYNQKDLNDKNVLIFSPSDVFTSYISNVLPELGEENVLTTTFKDFAENYIKGFSIESLPEFIERYYEGEKCSNDDTIKYKLSVEYKKELTGKLQDYFDSLKFKKKIGLKKTFISSEELNKLKEGVPKGLSFCDKINYLSEKVCSKFKIDEVGNSSKMYKILMKILEVNTDAVSLYVSLTGCELQGRVPYEDVFATLYVYFEVNGYPNLNYLKEIVIDEAQDYSLWQFEMFKKIFNGATFTILGDKNQAINPYLHYDTLEEIVGVFKNSKYKKLGRTYRSSREIIEYSNKILGLEGVESVRPSIGIAVEEVETNDMCSSIGECVKRYREKSFKRLAIITKTNGLAKFVKERINCQDVEILPVYMAKGLEYDAVILCKDDFNGVDKYLLYVGATRALHALTVVGESI